MGGEAAEPLQPRGCDQGPLRQGRALGPLRLKRAYPLRAPLLENRAARPLIRERAAQRVHDVDLEAELQGLRDEHAEELVDHLVERVLLADLEVLAIHVVLVVLVQLVHHWARS